MNSDVEVGKELIWRETMLEVLTTVKRNISLFLPSLFEEHRLAAFSSPWQGIQSQILPTVLRVFSLDVAWCKCCIRLPRQTVSIPTHSFVCSLGKFI